MNHILDPIICIFLIIMAGYFLFGEKIRSARLQSLIKKLGRKPRIALTACDINDKSPGYTHRIQQGLAINLGGIAEVVQIDWAQKKLVDLVSRKNSHDVFETESIMKNAGDVDLLVFCELIPFWTDKPKHEWDVLLFFSYLEGTKSYLWQRIVLASDLPVDSETRPLEKEIFRQTLGALVKALRWSVAKQGSSKSLTAA